MKRSSIPVSLPINESTRLLAYLKTKFHPGFVFKADMRRLCREYGKDPRTMAKLLKTLLDDGAIGQDQKAVYLRSWRYITGVKSFNLQSLELSLNEIKKKEVFEGKLFGAKITALQKITRREKGRVRRLGNNTDQSSLSSGFLAKSCQVSVGKVNKLKRKASQLGLVKVTKSFEDHGAGTDKTVRIAKRENPGLFLRAGRLTKRKPDQFTSEVPTYRIPNRKTHKIKK